MTQQTNAAPPVAFANWTGFYIGGDVGWGRVRETATATPFPVPFGAPGTFLGGVPGSNGYLPTSHDLGRDSLLGGVHVGYNWQVMHGLIGVEGDYMFLNANAANSQTLFATFTGVPLSANTSLQVQAKNDWLASARVRLGYVNDNWMIYGTGGVAWTETSYNVFLNGRGTGIAAFPAGSNANTFFDNTSTGYVFGGGLEWMAWQNWLLRVEYLHYEFDNATGNVPFRGGNCTLAAANCNWNIRATRANFDTARMGLSYKF